jgi:hypothetical protein
MINLQIQGLVVEKKRRNKEAKEKEKQAKESGVSESELLQKVSPSPGTRSG